MAIQFLRRGSGKPLILIHGLGSSRASWSLITFALAQHREVIAIDLPGHGASPAEADSGTFAGLVRSFDEWLEHEGLVGADMIGNSLGGRLVLEMARRGRAGAVAAFDPGGFWQGWERDFFYTTLSLSVGAMRLISPALPALSAMAAVRSALLAQFTTRPWALDGGLVATELGTFATTPTVDGLLYDLAFGDAQEGPAAPGSGPVTIGWGRHDRVLFPVQAERAVAAFPGARLVWFEHSAHFPQIEEPDEAVRVILEAVGS